MKTNKNTRRGNTQIVKNEVVICPPCGESGARATKEGQNWKKSLCSHLTAVLPQSGKTNFITLLWHYVPLPPRRGEDNAAMTSLPQRREITTRGFTLIELLVVVLIIGILAAVALPHYQLAVEKARLTEGITMMNNLQKAVEIWYYEHGNSKDIIDFLGQNATGELPIDLSGLDCSASISCESKDFVYAASWEGEEYPVFTISGMRYQNGVLKYSLKLSDFPTSWTKVCDVTEGSGGDGSDFSRSICKSLESANWQLGE